MDSRNKEVPLPWVIVAATFSLFQGALMLLFAWEQRRFLRSRAAAPLPEGNFPPVRLIVPCRGIDPQMEANLEALFDLDYPDLELCFTLESLRDPAGEMIQRLKHQSPHGVRLVEAGLAHDRGQKVHNLMAACRESRGDREIYAFVDSDARPHREWLKRLVDRLENRKVAAVTGYRWYSPPAGNWSGRVISALNNVVLGMLGPHGFNLAWGGAWAIRYETFRQIGLPQAWSGSLSDDIIVSRQLRQHRLRLAYEPFALVVSPAVFTWGGVGEFLRRQFLVVRNYTPAWWRLAFWGGGLAQVAFWSLATATLSQAVSGGAASLSGTLVLITYLLGVIRWHWVLGSSRPFIRSNHAEYDFVARLNAWLWPVVGLGTWLAVASAAWGKTIVWRGIRYSMDSPNSTRVLHHDGRPAVGSPSTAPNVAPDLAPATTRVADFAAVTPRRAA
jgi:ceramide glucosyltransferase